MQTQTATREYTRVGKEEYTKEEIDIAVNRIEWESFRTDNLPYCQGEAIKNVIRECNVPLSKISRMSLYGTIKGSHGFYGLDVEYKNAFVKIYIADNGCSCCPVAMDVINK